MVEAIKRFADWLSRGKGLAPGVFWVVVGCFFSNCGDLSVKLVRHLPSMQIAFMRVAIGTLLLVPWAVRHGKTVLAIKQPSWQLLRVITSFLAVWLWSYGASHTSLLATTTLSFTCPILSLPLAYFCLGERSDFSRIMAVLIAFLGVIVVASFEAEGAADMQIGFLHKGTLVLFASAILFALSDVLNKKLVAQEGVYSLLFYFCLGSSLLAAVPCYLVWQSLGLYEYLVLTMLASSGILLLFAILKAVEACDLAALAPYKYLEAVFSVGWGYFLFGEQLKWHTVIGCSLIVSSALWISYRSIHCAKKAKDENGV